jgi:hypothetical protein
MANYSRSESALRQPLTIPRVRVHQTLMTDTSHPSGVRVFGKSLYMLAGGWAASIVWLWLVGLRQHVYRFGTTPDDFAAALLLAGVVPALALSLLALAFGRMTGRAPTQAQERREWEHAFWWSLFPNVFLLLTAYLMIFGNG